MELLAVSVGNTRTRWGLFRGRGGRDLELSGAFPNADPAAIVAAILAAPVVNHATPIVIASVNDPASATLIDRLTPPIKARGGELFRLGSDLEIPIETTLTDERTVGQDRLLDAIGAYARAKQACIVIDAGTAITVDFVDGQGVFQGGVIAPGLAMMLQSLHEGTAALPSLPLEAPQGPEPWGKDTRSAMLAGVFAAARGLVHLQIDRYADAYGAYPQIVATGGDARVLFENDDLVENIVPDLTLMGIQAACAAQLGGDGADGGGPEL
ncbi:MAG: type III pantothenate kinase [Phycisphaerales bacterium]